MGLSLNSRRLSETRPDIQLPMDLVTEILTRLPTKSLMRFKCVSKLWSSLIRSQYFNRCFLKVPSQQQHLYICLSDSRDNRNSIILSSSAPLTTPTASTFVVNNDVAIQCRGYYSRQNVNGFMCNSYSKAMPRMYNPTTRQLVTLPAIYSEPQEHSRFFYGFGHDPVNDQSKVICSARTSSGFPSYTRISEYWVLDLKPGASWKKVTPASVDFCLDHVPLLKPGLSFNGVIYSLGLIHDIHANNYVVVSFDIGSEEFRTIQIPSIEGLIKDVTLIEYGGKLTVFDHTHLTNEGKFFLWVLEDAGNKEWSRKTLVLKPTQLHLVNDIIFTVKGTTQSGKVLLIPDLLLSPFHILCYDLQNNDMRKIDIIGIPNHWLFRATHIRFDLMFMDQSESIMHLDTLTNLFYL
ncbi:unnamed protein product [Microthlaspi erraticum]|uniref:F-box domain-containing protein n=1 Tax=Microthlaspi erraticum TaxID=1685480 RepID=A0A6D2LLN4_9BRAS|nr:unnamed protein product [Microthlaspi erraticum]